jgi:hypothetical protein
MRVAQFSIRCLVVASVIALFPGLASAQTAVGSVDPSDPTFLVVIISTPNCQMSQGSVQVHYDTYLLTPSVSGDYTIATTSGTGTTAEYVHEGPFNPADPMANCLAASNSGNPQTVTVTLTAGALYSVTVIDDTFAQLGDTYEIEVTGPAAVALAQAFPVPTLPQWGVIILLTGLMLAAIARLRRRQQAAV